MHGRSENAVRQCPDGRYDKRRLHRRSRRGLLQGGLLPHRRGGERPFDDQVFQLGIIFTDQVGVFFNILNIYLQSLDVVAIEVL